MAEVESNSKQLVMVWQTLESKVLVRIVLTFTFHVSVNHLHRTVGKHTSIVALENVLVVLCLQ